MNLQTSRTVIITGGNSGIGRGIAEAFARENTQVLTQLLQIRTYANNSQNPDSLVGAIHELPLPCVVLRNIMSA
ncbi:MAG: hypothetical protein HWQ41_22310 [Nostoc sp. NOS(2021)]|uniref:hypothetical protein n=1 Tax=Nostoc sp. NOS(2021) TaxID=2815407 RepID=UPI0025DBF654|nr:hypothetical protein [Nostoc sp. NOS(2021)]MBN3897899.1 hypothetical protein [Nostoc sp. NOS(2021)]